jgi:hypothetical protein
VEWGAGVSPSTWSAIATSTTPTTPTTAAAPTTTAVPRTTATPTPTPPTVGGLATLATWDTRSVPDGDYVIRVRLNDRKLGELQYAVAVVVSNSGGSGRTPIAAILAPGNGAVVRNSISVAGTASSTGTLQEYLLEVGEGTSPSKWMLLRRGTAPVVSGVLGDFNPTQFSLANGTYTIRLTVRDISGATVGSTITINLQR